MTLTDRYRRPADLPPRIPVFPLRGAILLPRATLPLNVFEPRYLAMVDDVMSGGRVIGILQPEGSDDDDNESPPGKGGGLRRIGCAGRVTSYQELDDGRLVITLTGIMRFECIDEAEAARLPISGLDLNQFAFDESLCADVEIRLYALSFDTDRGRVRFVTVRNDGFYATFGRLPHGSSHALDEMPVGRE